MSNNVNALSKHLADTYTLYLKTQNFHWNVTGPNFHSLHEMFEKQYERLAKTIDVLAERIRALGEVAPGSYTQFQQLSTLKEVNHVPSAKEMLEQLLADHERLIKNMQASLLIFEEAKDKSTEDIIIGCIEWHQKTAWMLRSTLN